MRSYEIQNQFGIDSLRLVERPDPTPGPEQVLVRVNAWSLNYRDWLIVTGQYNPKLKLPFVPGSDAVGEVIATGTGVSDVKVGDRVAACFLQHHVGGELTEAKSRTALGGAIPGVFSDLIVLSRDGVVVVPDHLTDAEAATLPCAGLTAWNALVGTGNVKAGDVVVVQGTGGVSLFALQFARMLGARVIVTSSRDDKLERARQLGAHHGINYKTTPDWGDEVRRLTGGVGADHIIEVGGAGTLPQSFRAARMGGTISLIGILSGGAANLSFVPVLMKHLRVQGIFVGHREHFQAMNRAIALHQMRPVVDRTFPFAELPAALRHLASGAHFGKIALVPV